MTSSQQQTKSRTMRAIGSDAIRSDLVADLTELAKAPVDPPDDEVAEPHYVQLSAIMFGLALVVFGLTIWVLFDMWALLLVVLIGAAFITFGMVTLS